MSVPLHSQIKPGVLVSIVLKQDQRTGRQVQGSVSQVLTRGNHPRGVKVRLSDGRVGRVQQLASQSPHQSSTTTGAAQAQKKYYRKMADHNPWADSGAQDSSYQGRQQQSQSYPQQQQQSQQTGYPEQRFYGEQPQQHQQVQPQAQGYSSAQDYYDQPTYNEPLDNNAWSDATGNPPLPQRHPQHGSQPQQPARRNTDDLLAREPDRGEQYEHMQAYEATARQSDDDKARAQLEKEFPDVDGSLIAALYSDTKDLSATREMLQELGRQ